MSADAHPAGAPASAAHGLELSLDERVADQQLRAIASQAVRVMASLVVLDTFLVWLLSRVGLFWPGLTLVAIMLILLFIRWRVLLRYVHGSGNAVKVARHYSQLSGVMGWVRAGIIPLLFALPTTAEHYVITMVLVGQMAGAVGSMLLYRGYLCWGLPLVLALALGWATQGSFEGAGVGALLLLLFAVLASNVKSNGVTLRQLTDLAHRNQALAVSLRVERDRAEAASQSKTRFFAAASHDLRQPLHALSINATTLELVSRRQNDPLIRELSQSINRALQQSNGLLQGLLDISKLDAGAVEVVREPVEVRALLATVAEAFHAGAAQRGVLVERADEPPGAPALWIDTDPELMLRVLNNLVSNAVKFTRHGSITLSARAIDGASDGQRIVVIGVRDTGCGIAADEQERVFEEFYQVANPSRDRSQGLGLGLAIVRRSVELLGATLTLRSKPGEGTWVEIRVAAASPAQHVRQAATSSPEAVWPVHLGAHVLVIDDEPEILRSLGSLLPHLGCEARCAESAAAAERLLDEGFRPQLLLVDQRLRDEKGTEVIARLRARLGLVAAVLVTGDTAPARIREAAASGWAVLHKPVNGAQLARAIEQALAEGSPPSWPHI